MLLLFFPFCSLSICKFICKYKTGLLKMMSENKKPFSPRGLVGFGLGYFFVTMSVKMLWPLSASHAGVGVGTLEVRRGKEEVRRGKEEVRRGKEEVRLCLFFTFLTHSGSNFSSPSSAQPHFGRLFSTVPVNVLWSGFNRLSGSARVHVHSRLKNKTFLANESNLYKAVPTCDCFSIISFFTSIKHDIHWLHLRTPVINIITTQQTSGPV